MTGNERFALLAVSKEPCRLTAIKDVFNGQYDLYTALSPAEALEILSGNSIHVVVVDQQLGEVCGTVLLEQLRAINHSSIRILICDPQARDQLPQDLVAADVFRYLDHPWDAHDLRNTVRIALKYHQSLQEQRKLTAELKKKNRMLKVHNKNLSVVLDKFEEVQDKLFEIERFSVIGKMASFIIHDLKQPLGIIRNSMEMLAGMELSREEKRNIEEIVKFELDRFTQMLHEILDYARGNTGLKFHSLPVADIFAIIDQDIQRYIANYDIAYRGQLNDDGATVSVDLTRFQRVIMNLVKNAIEAFSQSDNGNSPEIRFQVDGSADLVTFRVKDNGPGVAAQLKSRIFEPFISSKSTTGIGLGLAIVKKVVEAHDGQIDFTSQAGSGTEFIIHLKTEKAADGSP